MIDKTSFSPEWINDACERHAVTDPKVLERVIHAFALLEMLADSGLDFVFKGGTCIMLLFPGELKRMSVDIDIICPPGTDIAPCLERFQEFGFTSVEQQSREQPAGSDIPKGHAKLHYLMAFPQGRLYDSLYIQLDVLYEECHYRQVEERAIQLDIWKSAGPDLSVRIPSPADLLADKLTAFAPNTSGVPYIKYGDDNSVNVVKQLFDVGRLFNVVGDDIGTVAEVFRAICPIELSYRASGAGIQDVYDDIRRTAMSLACQEKDDATCATLTKAVQKFKSYLFQPSFYNLPMATADAAKAAYLATAIQYGVSAIEHFSGPDSIPQAPDSFSNLLNSKLLRLKKSNPEAFFYWVKTAEILTT